MWEPISKTTGLGLFGKAVKNIVESGDIKSGLEQTKDEVLHPINSMAEDLKSIIHKTDSPVKSSEINYGDVLAVKRYSGAYYHYAIYIGNDRVIHYASETGDFSGIIHEASYDDFKKESKHVYKLDFSHDPKIAPGKIKTTKDFVTNSRGGLSLIDALTYLRRLPDYHLYSPEETVSRAKSRLGEDKYSLPFNNCEHFAIWCKTGVNESHQVNQVLKILLEGPIKL